MCVGRVCREDRRRSEDHSRAREVAIDSIFISLCHSRVLPVRRRTVARRFSAATGALHVRILDMSDVIVVGGGLIGMLVARELAMAGVAVTLMERGELGRAASWAGGGILSPLYPWRYPDAVNVLCHWSQVHFPQLAAQLAEETGIDPEWTQSGLLVLEPCDQEAEDWARRWRGAVERIEPRYLERRCGGGGRGGVEQRIDRAARGAAGYRARARPDAVVSGAARTRAPHGAPR